MNDDKTDLALTSFKIGQYVNIGFALLMVFTIIGYLINKETAFMVHVFILMMYGTVVNLSGGILAAVNLLAIRGGYNPLTGKDVEDE